MCRDGVALLLVASVLLAGCSGTLLGEAIEHDVAVINEDTSAHDVLVTITRGEATILNETNRVGAGDRWAVATFRQAGDYRVVVETSGERRVMESYTLPLVKGDRKSFLTIRIRANGSLGAMVYWQS